MQNKNMLIFAAFMDPMQLKFTIIVSIIFMLIGIFGNLISILIFSNKVFKNISTIVYFKCICILNIIMMVYLPYGVAPIITDLTNVTCKIYEVLNAFFPGIKSWVLAFCSLDRLIFVLSPHKFQFKNKLKFQLSAIFVISTVVAVITVPYGYFFTIAKTTDNQSVCLASLDAKWVQLYFKVEISFFRTMIPFSIMIISSVMIGYKMFKKRRMLLVHRQRENHLLVSLIAMDAFFIVFRIPYISYFLTIGKGDNGGVIYNLTYSIIYSVVHLNSVLSVFVFIFFNNKYRQIFFKYMSLSLCSSKVSPNG